MGATCWLIITAIGTWRFGVTLLFEVEVLLELERGYYLGVEESLSFKCCMLVIKLGWRHFRRDKININ